MLCLARAIAGFSGGTEAVASAYIADMTHPSERTKHLGRLGVCGGLGFVLGPFLGSVFGEILGFSRAAWLAAAMSGVAFVIGIFTLKEPENRGKSRQPFNRKEMFQLATQPKFVMLFCAGFLLSFSWVGFEVTYSILGAEHYSMTAFQLGLIFAGFGVVYAGSQSLAGKFKEKLGEKYSLLIGSSILAILTFVLPFIPNLPVIITIAVVLAVALGMIDFSLPGLISINTPPERQGFVFGILRSFGSLGRAISPVSMGALYDREYHLSFVLAGILSACSFVLILFVPNTKTPSNETVTQEYTRVEVEESDLEKQEELSELT